MFVVAIAPTAEPEQAIPTLTPEVVAPAASAYELCLVNPDRFNWQKYAAAYSWPLDQVAQIVHTESGGDLCAVNASSGATCWIQQHPGGPAFFDPTVCMSQAYAKWVDGGDSWWRHWCRWWPAAIQHTCPG